MKLKQNPFYPCAMLPCQRAEVVTSKWEGFWDLLLDLFPLYFLTNVLVTRIHLPNEAHARFKDSDMGIEEFSKGVPSVVFRNRGYQINKCTRRKEIEGGGRKEWEREGVEEGGRERWRDGGREGCRKRGRVRERDWFYGQHPVLLCGFSHAIQYTACSQCAKHPAECFTCLLILSSQWSSSDKVYIAISVLTWRITSASLFLNTNHFVWFPNLYSFLDVVHYQTSLILGV